jgi:hypothetical protein
MPIGDRTGDAGVRLHATGLNHRRERAAFSEFVDYHRRGAASEGQSPGGYAGSRTFNIGARKRSAEVRDVSVNRAFHQALVDYGRG